MKHIAGPDHGQSPGWVRWGVFCLTLVLAYGPVLFLTIHIQSLPLAIALFIPALLASILTYRMMGWWSNAFQAQRQFSDRLIGTEDRLRIVQLRLSSTLQLGRQMAEAEDESSLMHGVLDLVSRLAGAAGASYTPLDDLGQPLVSVQIGLVPEAIAQQWTEYLISPAVREACRVCQVHRASGDADCPMLEPIYSPSRNVYCLTLQRGNRVLGIINLFLPGLGELSEDLTQFLSGLVNEIAVAIETIRYRSQEISTLKQIQLVHSPQMDLGVTLTRLLENTQQALESDYALIWLRGKDKLTPQVMVGGETSACLNTPQVETIIQQVLASGEIITHVAGSAPASLPEGVGAILAAPLQLPGAITTGVLVIGNAQPVPFYPRQYKLVQTVASQVALLVENERLVVEMEYRAVIEERTRLAREIHDGLAQTLAFLKLQANQMESYLTRGDLDRLHSALRSNLETLSEAYLETRQAIDNLRVKPRENLREWLDQIVIDFQTVAKIPVDIDFPEDPIILSQEIQAHLVRVVQEALSNIRKHSQASHVCVAFHAWNEDLILEISDDGRGFSPEDVPTVSQHGLRGMRERADMIGAEFQVISQPDKGTTIRLRLPYRFEEEPV